MRASGFNEQTRDARKPKMVGMARRAVPARSKAEGGTNVVGHAPRFSVASPDATLGDADGAAHRPYPFRPGVFPRAASKFCSGTVCGCSKTLRFTPPAFADALKSYDLPHPRSRMAQKVTN